MYTSMSLCLSPLQCLPDQVLSERAEGEFRGMTGKESTALCDRVVIFLPENPLKPIQCHDIMTCPCPIK